MLSTDPSYDNRTIASTLKMQIWIATNNRDVIIMPPHIFEVDLKVNTKVYLDVQKDSAPAYKSKETQAWLQKECYDFVPFSNCPTPPPTWTR